MLESISIMEKLIHKEGFPNAASAIYRNKLSPGLLSGFLEKVKFSSSSNHNCFYLAIKV